MKRLVRVSSAGAVGGLAILLALTGCHQQQRKSTSQPNTPDYAAQLQTLVSQPQMPLLRWPNYSDYQGEVKTFYDDRDWELAWTRDGKPTGAASGFIESFRAAGLKGLRPEDYDAAQWQGRVDALRGKDASTIAKFDVAMTIDVMRFISNLRIGRVNPQHFNFDIDTASKRYNLPEFVSDQAVDAADVPQLIHGVEPDSDEYRKTEDALSKYLQLAQQQGPQPEQLPEVAKGSSGHRYPALPQLWQRLQLEGDADAAARAPASDDAEFADAIKSYQERHGLTADGKLNSATVNSLNVPMSARVAQLDASLERWRWLPDPYLKARLIVNLPEFVLRGFDEDHNQQFKMKVVVGQTVDQHATPVFTHMMKYLIFRPYWTVPVDITNKELVPHIRASSGYLESHNFEVVNYKGEVQPDVPLDRLEHGRLMVREKPGPRNSLGLIKFMFPNQYDIYLHSTPAQQLFSRTRRAFSHGCVRVEKPADLAVWVLGNQTGKDGQPWDLQTVTDAMQNGPDNHQVNLKTPLPIVIFYTTARVDEQGKADFFDDLYGYDADMQKVLDKGPPYPLKPEPVKPATTPGDTV